jgi:N-methylhydantoinase A
VILGVDVGGTFTDLTLWDGAAVVTAKVPTTPDQSEGVLAGAAELVDGRLERLFHGTTIATNALLERKGARTGLITSTGFTDVIEIGRQDRPSLYDPMVDRPCPLVARADRVGIVSPEELDLDRLAGCEAIAVCLLSSYADPASEHAVLERLATLGVPVSLSVDVAPEFREYERTSTTVLNAYLTPVVAEYLTSLVARVRDAGLAADVGVMRSSGGLIAAIEGARLPASILLSGPAAGVVAAAELGAAHGVERLISFDMGGTSTDVCRIDAGRPEISYERPVGGYPCRLPGVAIHTVGAGGGSLGWLDSGGSLRVGPASAGSLPGPACYGRGGTRPTVTDANVALGRIAPQASLGGRLPIERSLADEAIGRLAVESGVGREEAALGMVDVVEEVMAGAIRTVSIEQGADPRDAVLVAFGGAGGLHAASLARRLDMAGVLVPARAGVFSALGLLLSPPRIDVARSVLLTGTDEERLDAVVHRLATAAEAELRAAGAEAESVSTFVDARYLGQSHELTVPYAAGDGWEVLGGRFHRLHAERNGFARPADPLEAVTVRAEAAASPALTVDDLPGWDPVGEAECPGREVRIAGGAVPARVFRRDGLAPGFEAPGPAVIEEREATTYIGPGERFRIHESGAVEISW